MLKLIAFILALLLLLVACGKESSEEPNSLDEGGKLTEEGLENGEEPEEGIDPYDFFMPDASTATFLGEGNEYASFTLRTVFLDDKHIATYEDNGGTVVLKVYRIGDNSVELVKEQAEFYEDFAASSEELEALQPIRTYLTLPLEVGTVIGDWVVTQSNGVAATPFESFENVIVLENEETENTINKTYFAEGYGEVKREFRMLEEGQDEFIVTSVLESVEME
ncbi:putative lipoprotein [Planococcus halocryophilus Or1]|uniref:Uncharacterized protein n=1 Tax=Planococcus halocryophilus TaxID=1215089 RepID=A0A1C7DR07_9BACL|nr:hypothetical protein [Planococcus halocryophilus]ANU13844.1 hypothetical protein BBI08_08270 [Planococcus halocryophilus]EMF47579.1 putative lipoprotein [Planococcus halocryophilus Or1]